MHIKDFSYLACPIDHSPLIKSNNSLYCKYNHSFDYAKQGYINLLLVQHKSSKQPGDTQEMMLARRDFLNKGLYQPIADTINNIIEKDILEQFSQKELVIVDAGSGEGYYLYHLINYLKKINHLATLQALGFDISKWAIKMASSYPDITWIVANNRYPPLQTASVDIMLSIFGFPEYNYFKDILKPSGKLLLVDAAPQHLIELRKIIYPYLKASPSPTIQPALEQGYTLIKQEPLTYAIKLTQQEMIQSLLKMTPHYFRISSQAKEELSKIETLEVTIDIIFRLLNY